jgi:dipeptidyl aminopeptidase/acylaminoacyl peptidase
MLKFHKPGKRKGKLLKKIIFLFLLLILLSGCSTNPTAVTSIDSHIETPAQASPLPSVTPTDLHIETPTQATLPPAATPTQRPAGQEIITTKNINQLELLYRLGKGDVLDVDISPDGKTEAISTSTGFNLYDIPSKTERTPAGYPFSLKIDEQDSRGVAFSPDGKFLAMASSRIIIWNLLEGRIETQIENPSVDFPLTQIEFSYDGKQVFTTGGGIVAACDGVAGAFQLFDIKSGKLLYSQGFCTNPSIHFSRAAADGNIYFTGINPKVNGTVYDTAIVESATGKIINHLKSAYEGHIYDVNSDGTLAAVWADRGAQSITNLLDLKTRNVVKSIEGSVLFLPGTRNYMNLGNINHEGWVLKDSNDATLCAFKDKKNELSLSVESTFQPNFKLRGKSLVVWDFWKDEIQFWNTSNCRLIQTLPIYSADGGLIFSLDGKTIATQSTYSIILWDVATRQMGKPLVGKVENGPLSYYAFDPNGTRVIASTVNSPYLIDFFDIKKGELIKTQDEDWSYKDSTLNSMAVSPDGSAIALLDHSGLRVNHLD